MHVDPCLNKPDSNIFSYAVNFTILSGILFMRSPSTSASARQRYEAVALDKLTQVLYIQTNCQ